MKLKNKKTGEIGNLVLNINPNRESYSVLSTENGDTVCGNLVLADYDSLSDLNEEWTDYEEQKGNWTIDPMNENYIDDGRYTAPDELERYEELGLKFNTEEEAEKAVEKLKAWKRLKELGFRFIDWEQKKAGKKGPRHYENQTPCLYRGIKRRPTQKRFNKILQEGFKEKC